MIIDPQLSLSHPSMGRCSEYPTEAEE